MQSNAFQVGGVSLPRDTELMSHRMLDVLESGNYEQDEAREIARIIEDGERVVELGAGLGYIATLAYRTGKTQSIALYEANPGLVPLIERTRSMNGVDFEIHNKVVLPSSRPPKQVPFYVRHDFWASSLAPEPWGYKVEVEVNTISWKAMMAKHRPTLLIVDVEGGEDQLFRGVDLTGLKKVYMELHMNVIGRRGVKRLLDFFSAQGFHYDPWHSHGPVVLLSHVDR